MSEHLQASSHYVPNAGEHPTLDYTDAASIWAFLCSYDQNVREVSERAKQFLAKDVVVNDLISPVSVKFCFHLVYSESFIELGFIPEVSGFDELTEEEI